MTDIDEVFEMGYAEYLFRMEMYSKRQTVLLEETLYEAWLNQRQVVAQKKKGEYVYKNFEELKKIIKKPTNRQGRDFSKLRKLAAFQRDFKREEVENGTIFS